ncbi:putative cell segregation machinery component [Scheffersomyces xylosifermentans]|uniref:putative cell segregation machinery component n=1 Tax=Scheffersomyces xylosifermentans TaxID=1304137 RepID=UPI00315CEBD3
MAKEATKTRKNVLPNTYIPVLSKRVLGNVLTRLPKQSLIEFIYIWPKLANTQPHLDKENKNHSQKAYSAKVSEDARALKKIAAKVPKRKIIDKIIYQYWSDGLNLLQLSQLDCQLIVDRPNAYYWIKSTVKDSFDKEVPISLDPQVFLDQLANDLNMLYLTYLYLCRHPSLPLMVIRIQLFDLQAFSTSGSSNRPHITSLKAYFLAIPLNSPHILHSPGNDLVTNIVMQVVERSLPQNPNNLVKIATPKDQTPIRSLESMHILHGNSRFGNSLGIWTPYADSTVDMLPFNALEKHSHLKDDDEDGEINDIDDENVKMTKLKKMANLRFKGSINGKLKSEKLYEDNRKTSARKRKNIYSGKANDDDFNESDEDEEESEFASIAPIQFSEFVIKRKVQDKDDEKTSIKMRLTGSDVFAGLHELSVRTTDKSKMIVDPAKVPGWLTGEEGASCGILEDSVFRNFS